MFQPNQIKFLQSLGLEYDFDRLSEEQLVQIEDVVSEKLQISGFNEDYQITPVGKMCESILDTLSAD